MIIIGVDFHPEFQQIAFVVTDTGELEERRVHHPGEAEAFYRAVVSQGKTLRVGMEASGHWCGSDARVRLRVVLSTIGPTAGFWVEGTT